MSLHFAVFYGSVRSERQGIKYARFLNAQLAARQHQVSFVDPLEYRLPLLDKMHKEYPAGAAPGPLPELADIIRSADGFMIVSGEYNHSIPPALANLLDLSSRNGYGGHRLLLGRGVRKGSGSDAAAQPSPSSACRASPPFIRCRRCRISSTTTEIARPGARASGRPLPR